MLIYNAINKYQNINEKKSKAQQIIMLYEGIMKFLYKAKISLTNGDLEGRYNNINKASDIIHGLLVSLDLEEGGEIAQKLDIFYKKMIAKLNFLIIKNQSAEHIENVIQEVKLIKSAWEEIDRQHASDKHQLGLNSEINGGYIEDRAINI